MVIVVYVIEGDGRKKVFYPAMDILNLKVDEGKLVPLYYKDQKMVVEIPKRFGVLNVDTNKIEAIVSSYYKLCQHWEIISHVLCAFTELENDYGIKMRYHLENEGSIIKLKCLFGNKFSGEYFDPMDIGIMFTNGWDGRTAITGELYLINNNNLSGIYFNNLYSVYKTKFKYSGEIKDDILEYIKFVFEKLDKIKMLMASKFKMANEEELVFSDFDELDKYLKPFITSKKIRHKIMEHIPLIVSALELYNIVIVMISRFDIPNYDKELVIKKCEKILR